ncbi:hypothetical protein SteCoe_22294 [Stentor coeruleus]|uniref:RING-type domain-containing protein n=1 Tax=Stentor coeruleus TaxID=5963 RepID=A0A1R2BMU1_9CILI|nr:hypothetical protein SteCoe_22294 [Stentor coeruleus]
MSIIPSSCQSNKITYQARQFLLEQKPSPNDDEIIVLSRSILKYARFTDQASVNTIFSSLLEIKNQKDFNANSNSHFEYILNHVRCQLCFSAPKNVQIFPYLLCNGCNTNIRKMNEIPKCLYCACSYRKKKYRFDCQHLCLFCAALMTRKGYKSCLECNKNYGENLEIMKKQQFSCESCQDPTKEKLFYDNYILRCECRHLHCYNCLIQCIKEKKCITSNEPLSKTQINYAINYLSAKCGICRKRKKRDCFVMKSCCFEDICKGCQKNQINCAYCKSVIQDLD